MSMVAASSPAGGAGGGGAGGRGALGGGVQPGSEDQCELSVDQIFHLKDLFNSADVDGGGALDVAEVGTLILVSDSYGRADSFPRRSSSKHLRRF